MRHRKKGKVLDRKVGPRKALMVGLVQAFLRFDRMTTTLAKAKAVQPLIERSVTRARTPSLAHRRWLISKLGGDQTLATKLIVSIAPRFQTRPGGYTRLTHLPARKGDAAKMAFLEWTTNESEKVEAKGQK